LAKATFNLLNGTVVTIEGESTEIEKILDYYSNSKVPDTMVSHNKKEKSHQEGLSQNLSTDTQIEYSEIIKFVKNCDEAESIEKQILDKTSQIDRTLLPLYIIHEYLGNKIGLTSGDINKITIDLGIPIATSNISRTLAGTASRYVIGDQVRSKGQPVRYKLSRRGVQYFTSVISGNDNDSKE